jgi:hypothetical protein
VIGCAGFDALLRDFGEGGVERRNPEFLRHLAACPPCLAVFVAYSRSIEMARIAYDERDEEAPPLPDARVRAIVEAAFASPRENGQSFDVA